MEVDRRLFLLGSTAMAASAFQGDSSVATAMIGVGGRGSFLLTGVMQQPNAKVVALCDIKPDRLDKAATAAAKFNPTTYADWHRILERKDVEAVYIATPPYLHSEMAIAAIRAGKHVYCEKPVGITPEQVCALLDAARGNKKVFVAGQQLRSQKQLGETVRKIHEGVIGDVIMVKAQRHAPADLPHDGTSGDWYFDVTKSGGYLIEQSVHNLDLCNWAIGAHPLRAAGFGATVMYKNDPPGRTIFDCGSITYEYPNGIKMSFTQNVFHPQSMPNGNQYVYVYGTKGAVDLTPSNMYAPGRNVQPVLLAEKQQEDQYAHLAMFYDCIANGKPPVVDVKIGAAAALTAILGHEAMVQEKVVRWTDFGVDV